MNTAETSYKKLTFKGRYGDCNLTLQNSEEDVDLWALYIKDKMAYIYIDKQDCGAYILDKPSTITDPMELVKFNIDSREALFVLKRHYDLGAERRR